MGSPRLCSRTWAGSTFTISPAQTPRSRMPSVVHHYPHSFWGPSEDGADLARLAQEDGHQVDQLDDSTLIDKIADDLASGRIIGWMDGALEFGPRALGHRSILAAPHTVEMRDRLNREIK